MKSIDVSIDTESKLTCPFTSLISEQRGLLISEKKLSYRAAGKPNIPNDILLRISCHVQTSAATRPEFDMSVHSRVVTVRSLVSAFTLNWRNASTMRDTRRVIGVSTDAKTLAKRLNGAAMCEAALTSGAQLMLERIRGIGVHAAAMTFQAAPSSVLTKTKNTKIESKAPASVVYRTKEELDSG